MRDETWVDTLLATRAAIVAAGLPPEEESIAEESSWRWFQEDFPIAWDWLLQDGPASFGRGLVEGACRDAVNPDGTGQTEFYGNNSWFPTTIVHARGIPGSNKAMAIFCGHHTPQTGKLGILDPARGRQENQGAQLIAPVRPTPAVRVDEYGQEGDLFQHPFPLTEDEFLITYAPLGWGHRDGQFGIYWMDRDGRRELLACDPAVACRQAVPAVARTAPPVRPTQVDDRRADAVFLLEDIHVGPGLAGIPRGAVKRLRVVALDFRAAGIGHNYNQGAAGGALICTPIAIGNGSWDVKIERRVLIEPPRASMMPPRESPGRQRSP